MNDMSTAQLRVVSPGAIDPNQVTGSVSFFDGAGNPVDFKSGEDLAFAPITTATAIGTAAKTTASSEPAANTIVPIKFTNGNSVAAPTVAFNGGAARAVQLGGATPATGEIVIAANGVALFWFDGTILHQIGVYS